MPEKLSFPYPVDRKLMIQSAQSLKIEFFTDEELNLIFQWFKNKLELLNQNPKKNAKYIRDIEKYNLLTIILLETGGRIGEVLQLTPMDFNLSTGTIRLITLKKRKKKEKKDENKDSKENKEQDKGKDKDKEKIKPIYRYIPIHRDLKEAFLTYIAKYHIDMRSEERLFKQSQPAINEFFRKMEKEIEIQTGVKIHIHAHKFRHTFAIKSILAGVPLNVIQDWLAHSSIFVTSIYLKITGRDTSNFMNMIEFLGGEK